MSASRWADEKNILIVAIAVLSHAYDVANALEYKQWKIFQSDFGYEVKIPECWKIQRDNPDSGPIMEKNYEVIAEESDECRTPKLESEIPNGIGIYVGRATITNEDAKKEIDSETTASVFRLQRKDYLIFKKFKLEDGLLVLAHAEHFH